MSLHRCVYTSRGRNLGRADLDAILASCERNSPGRAITGMLLFDRGHFVQLLEGPRAEVTACFLTIGADPRHSDVHLLAAGPLDARLFADWSMHYVPEHGRRGDILRRYSAGQGFRPDELSIAGLEQICL